MSEYNLDDDGSKYYICGGCGQACGCNDDEEVALRSRVKELEAERDTWVELRAVSDMRVKELRARVEELEARLEIPGPGDSPPLQADVVLCAMVFGAKYKNKGSTFPLWSHVGELAAHGSGYSAAICRWVGLNPDTGEPLEGGEEDE